MQSYVSIDLETTGLNPKTDKIIEIGAVKVVDGQAAGTFSTLISPGRRLEPRVAELTGIREEELRNQPRVEEVFPALCDFLGELPLLGHRVLFDFSFLKRVAVNERVAFEKQAVDTLKLARKFLPDLESRSLEYLCGHYRIPHHAHRALADAEATDALYRRLKAEFYAEGESLFQPVQLVYKAKRDQPAAKPQLERLYRLVDQHKLILDVEIERLTRSEASRLTDKILSSLGR